MEQVGQRIAQARRERGLSRHDLGEILGVSTVTVGRWETGEREPRHDALQRLAATLNRPLSYFLSDEPGEHSPAGENSPTADLATEARRLREKLEALEAPAHADATASNAPEPGARIILDSPELRRGLAVTDDDEAYLRRIDCGGVAGLAETLPILRAYQRAQGRAPVE